MKKFVSILSIMLFFVCSVYSQNKILDAPSINWLGLDFSKCRLIDKGEFYNGREICERYIPYEWNEIMCEEYDKFNVKRYYKNEFVFHHHFMVRDNNQDIEAKSITINESYSITKNDLQEIVDSYDEFKSDGVGLVFIVEYLNDRAREASVWVVFFDCKTREIYKARNYTELASGASAKSFWLNAFHRVMKKGPILISEIKHQGV